MKRLLLCFFALMLSFTAIFSLASCEKAYTAAETDTLITEINAAITTNKAELDAKISELTEEYEADDTKNKEELESKITALESAYYAKIAELISLIEEINELDGTQNGKIDDLNGYVDEKLAEINKKHAEDLSRIEEKVNEILSAHKHTFGDYVSFSGNENVYCHVRLYFKICEECAALEWKIGSDEDHSFTTVTTEPTCTSSGFDTKTCTYCGFIEITNEVETIPHSWESEYRCDADYHWINCADCDEKKDKSEHVLNDKSACTVCGEEKCNTKGLKYKLSSDGSYADVTGYEGTAKVVNIASTYEEKPVKGIYAKAFRNHSNITAINIPDGVEVLDYSAFLGCSSLTEIYIPDTVNWIGPNAFENCVSLTSVHIPTGVDSIPPDAFRNCTSIKSVTIPDNVEGIGAFAFAYCSALENITFGSGIELIGTNAFLNCENLTNAYINDIDRWRVIEFDGFNSHPMRYAKNFYINGKIAEEITIPDGTKAINDFTFYNISSIKKVTIPTSVESIGSYAFLGCTNLPTDGNGIYYADNWVVGSDKSIDTANIKDGTVGIAYLAFCESDIKSITIPVSLKYVNISYCENLKNVYISDIEAWCNLIDGYIYNPFHFEKDLYLNGSLLTDLIIPTGLKKIEHCAFENCSSIKSVFIPGTVTTIEEGAFGGCKNLETIVFEDGIEVIEEYAFSNCEKITSVTFPPSIKVIEKQAFSNCEKLTSVTIPPSIKVIDKIAFVGCTNLKKVYYDASNMPWSSPSPELNEAERIQYTKNSDGKSYKITFINYTDTSVEIPSDINGLPVVEIEENALTGTKIESVTIPKNVKVIGSNAFKNCTRLKSVIFDDMSALEKIGAYAFQNCTEIKEITIPVGVTEICESAFEECTSLEKITLSENTELIGKSAFESCYSLFSIDAGENIKTIDDGAFIYCVSLAEIVIPASVEYIGIAAFEWTALINVKFENTDGWWYAESADATDGTAIEESALEDEANAATLLLIDYAIYCLRRG